MLMTLKLVGVVLLWLILYALTPHFGHPVADGLAPIALAAFCYAVVFRLWPASKNRAGDA